MWEQNLGGHIISDDREVKSVVTRWLVTQDADLYREGIQNFDPQYDKCLNFGGTMWRSSGISVQLNVNFFYGGKDTKFVHCNLNF